MTITYRYRKQIIIAIGLILLLVGGGFLLFTMLKAQPVAAKKVLTVSKKEQKQEKREEATYYKVDIKGAIVTPGIYTLKKESRVMDAIEQAGGITESADTSVINLSKKISDEMVIIIYTYEQVREFAKTKEIEKQVQENCQTGGEYGLENDACIEKKQGEKNIGKISLNTATKEELMLLTGIGEAKAIAIIEYREQNGAFEKIEDIMNVSGIGESLFAKIKENITI